MLVAEAAILLKLHPVGMILLFFGSVVVPLLALCAGKRNFCPHALHPLSVIMRVCRTQKKT
jgi:hypothetical protein